MIIVLGYAIWFAWTFFERAILDGKLLLLYKEEFLQSNFFNQIGIILAPLGLIIPLVLAGVIVYLLTIAYIPFFKKKQYHMLFSKNGIDMAGHFFSWNSIIWFGAKRVAFSQNVIPCCAIKGIRHGIVRLQVPSIKPISQELFAILCNEIRARLYLFHHSRRCLNFRKA